MSLQQEQQPIFERIANALIEATPESWSEATLELTSNSNEAIISLAHSIFSTTGHRELVQPTPDLLEATQQLQDLSVRCGDRWLKCVFHVVQEGQTWRFITNFHR